MFSDNDKATLKTVSAGIMLFGSWHDNHHIEVVSLTKGEWKMAPETILA
jgi:hypothetical protein